MEVGKVVLSVFAFLGMAIVAVLLYDLLFAYDYTASSSAQGDGNDHMGSHSVQEIRGSQKGALWVLADTIQENASFYVYNYCYLPIAHETDVLDQQMSLSSQYYMVDDEGNSIESDATPTNLHYAELVNMPATSSSRTWSTGWK